jgi:UDPglucose 6-dehydrogenase
MITVFGLWHLGSVTAACCAKHFKTVGLDFNEDVTDQLRKGQAPLFEPGLDDLIANGLSSQMLSFSSDPKHALIETRVLWVTYDTPVDENDVADVGYVIDQVSRVIPYLAAGSVVLISSQLPVGTVRDLEKRFANQDVSFAYSPENLRLSNAIQIFTEPDRIIAGVRDSKTKEALLPILAAFSNNIIWMSTESAEMTKHAINCFLAMSVSFANELANLCEISGANAHEVAHGLKSEARIGNKAYVGPGGAFAGGTLARDVQFLTAYGESKNLPLHVIPSIKMSNDLHKNWPLLRLKRSLGNLAGKKIAVLGLTYKPGTNTLRRSNSVELCRELLKEKVEVVAYDPAIKSDQPELGGVLIEQSVDQALLSVDAVIIMTEWPEFKKLNWGDLISKLKVKTIIDQNRFCGDNMDTTIPDLNYLSVGVP